MKDGYSFDRSEEAAFVSFEKNREAYHRIFERCGIEAQEVKAESGIMGGELTFDFLAPSGSGENTLVRCENGDYAADAEIAQGVPRAPVFPPSLDAPEEVETPGVTTIEALAEFLGIDATATSKAMPVTTDDGRVVLALVRGDDRLSESKLLSALKVASRPSTDEEIREAFGASGGSLGPVGFGGEVVADLTLQRGAVRRRREPRRLPPARRPGRPGLRARLRRPARARRGRPLPRVRRRADLPDRDRGRPHLLLRGQVQLRPRRDVPRRGRQGEAAPRRQLRDRPRPRDGGGRRAERRRGRTRVARRDFTVRCARDRTAGGRGDRGPGGRGLSAAGRSVLLDDRDARAGEKFADADLIGIPLRITAGKKSVEDGRVDVERPRDGRGTPRRPRGARLGGQEAPVQRGAVRPDDRAADGRDRHDLPRARRQDRALRRLSQPHRPRQPPGAVERRHRQARQGALASSPSTSSSTASA